MKSKAERLKEAEKEIIALFKECVPEELKVNYETTNFKFDNGWNACRAETLRNIEELRK